MSTTEGATGAADQRPLTQQEFQLLQRLLSDPFSLPIQFKTWLISYIETSDITLPMSAILGLQSMLGVTGVGGGTLGILPAGIIFPFGGDSAPAGSLLCDGQTYAITTHQRLYDAIGTRFGSGGAGTFNVPDLQSRIPVGKGVTADHDTIGKSDGLPVGARWVKHGHGYDFTWTPETPMGFHNFNGAAGGDANDIYVGTPYENGEVGNHSHGSNASLTRVGVHGTAEGPAYLTVNFIIVS